jgi:hypothetical protein
MVPTALQIFATAFALFALSRVLLRFKAHQLAIRETLFWSVIWLGGILVLWVPATAEAISGTLGLNTRQPIDTLVYISIILLFYLAYRVHAKQEQTEQQVTQLVRQISLRNAEQPVQSHQQTHPQASASMHEKKGKQ